MRRADGTDHGVVPADRGGYARRIDDVALHHSHAVGGPGEARWVAHHRGHLVAAPQRFVEDAPADDPAGAEQGDSHGANAAPPKARSVRVSVCIVSRSSYGSTKRAAPVPGVPHARDVSLD